VGCVVDFAYFLHLLIWPLINLLIFAIKLILRNWVVNKNDKVSFSKFQIEYPFLIPTIIIILKFWCVMFNLFHLE